MKQSKYKDMVASHCQLRYVLLYADDVIADNINIKKDLFNKMPMRNGESIYEVQKLPDNEELKRKMRQEHGIYFDVNVYPSSPKKVISPKQTKSKLLVDLKTRYSGSFKEKK